MKLKSLLSIFTLTILLSSCSSHVYKTHISEEVSNISKQKISNAEKIPLVINTFNLIDGDGKEFDVTATFTNKLIKRFKKMGVFSEIIYNGSTSGINDYMALDIDIMEDYNGRANANYWKAYFVGFTLFATAPFTKLKYDYNFKMDCHFERRENNKTISAQESRTLSKKWLSKETPDDLINHVVIDVCKSLEKQINDDIDYYTK